MLRIDDDQYAALVAHARAEYPNEACALLGGRDGSVERVYALPNAEASPTFYVVEPKAQLRAMTEMDDLGLDLVGIFHSHVATEAYLRDHVQLEQGLPPVVATLLSDAQTSGGLLLAVAPGRLGGLVADLRGRGIEPAVIGRVLDGPPGRVGVRRLPSG